MYFGLNNVANGEYRCHKSDCGGTYNLSQNQVPRYEAWESLPKKTIENRQRLELRTGQERIWNTRIHYRIERQFLDARATNKSGKGKPLVPSTDSSTMEGKWRQSLKASRSPLYSIDQISSTTSWANAASEISAISPPSLARPRKVTLGDLTKHFLCAGYGRNLRYGVIWKELGDLWSAEAIRANGEFVDDSDVSITWKGQGAL